MSIVIESYSTGTGINATIEKEKYSSLFYVTVYTLHGNIPVTEYRNSFTAISNARKAIKRLYPGISKAEV